MFPTSSEQVPKNSEQVPQQFPKSPQTVLQQSPKSPKKIKTLNPKQFQKSTKNITPKTYLNNDFMTKTYRPYLTNNPKDQLKKKINLKTY